MKEKAYQSKPLLTKREREVFELLVQDKTTKEIAGELLSVKRQFATTSQMSCVGIAKDKVYSILRSVLIFFIWKN